MNPLTLFQNSLAESRTLRILFLVSVLGWILLLYPWLMKDVSPRIVALLYFFHLLTWFFALATRKGMMRHRDIMNTPAAHKLSIGFDYGCQGVLVFCQILFLLAVFRLMETPQ